MTYHSKNEVIIRPGDIFFSKHLAPDNKTIGGHYFVCVYSQVRDTKTNLHNDIVGVLLTSNKKYQNIYDEYAVKIEVFKPTYACVDKQFRFSSKKVSFVDRVSEEELEKILIKIKKFSREIERQMYEAKRVLRKQ